MLASLRSQLEEQIGQYLRAGEASKQRGLLGKLPKEMKATDTTRAAAKRQVGVPRRAVK